MKIWRFKNIPFYDIPVKVYENLYFEEKTADKKSCNITQHGNFVLYCKKIPFCSVC